MALVCNPIENGCEARAASTHPLLRHLQRVHRSEAPWATTMKRDIAGEQRDLSAHLRFQCVDFRNEFIELAVTDRAAIVDGDDEIGLLAVEAWQQGITTSSREAMKTVIVSRMARQEARQ